MRTLLPTLIAAFGMASASTPAPITSVTVRDADFAEVKVLDAAELDPFARMWASRHPVDLAQAEGGTHYKIDIGTGGRSQRYLYYTSGLVTLLAKNVQPVYRVADPAAFNRLVGAVEREDPGEGAAP